MGISRYSKVGSLRDVYVSTYQVPGLGFMEIRPYKVHLSLLSATNLQVQEFS